MPYATYYSLYFDSVLDHIIFNADVLKLIKLLEIPEESEFAKEKALPNLKFPSDHIRLEAYFLLPK